MSHPDKKNKFKLPKPVRAAVVAMAATAAVAGCGNETKPSTEKQKAPNQTGKLAPEVRQQAKALDAQGKAAARATLSLLGIEASGAEAYKRRIVSNKAAIVGPDKKMYTADDQPYQGLPESTARYYPATGRLYVRSTAENRQGPEDPITGFRPLADALVILDVGKNNPIREESGQLTADDFAEAVDYPGSKVVAVSGSYNKGFSSQTTESSDATVFLSRTGKLFTDPVSVEELALGTDTTGGARYREEYLTNPSEQAEAIAEAAQTLGQASYLIHNQANQVLQP